MASGAFSRAVSISLRLLNVKTALELDRLRVKIPVNARKTLRMAQIAYNLIKSSCQEAANP